MRWNGKNSVNLRIIKALAPNTSCDCMCNDSGRWRGNPMGHEGKRCFLSLCLSFDMTKNIKHKFL